METRFVKPFAAQKLRAVVNKRTGKCLGVFDGACNFDNGYYALLQDGTVKLYDYRNRQLYGDLDDVWVAPNGYQLIKRKGDAQWKLFNGSHKKCAEGEKAAVFCQGGTALVFLKQCGTSEWYFYNVEKNSFCPSLHVVSANEVEVWQQGYKLYFILTLDGRKTLQRINMLYMKSENEIRNVICSVLLPDGSIALAEKPLSVIVGGEFQQVMPSEGSVFSVYSADLKFRFCADGIVMFSCGAYLHRCGGEWSLYAGGRIVKGGIFNVKSYSMFTSCGRDTVGQTADGKPVILAAPADEPEKLILDYADERYFILDGKKVVRVGAGQDIFLI